MSDKEKKTIYQLAVEKYGANNQMNMALEECGEFIVAINKFRRAKNNTDATEASDNICDEVADVIIMMEQMQVMFGIDRVERIKVEKLKRLEQRLHGKDPLHT